MSFAYFFRLFCFLTVTTYFSRSGETDLILLIAHNHEYWCITNGSEPVTWLDVKNPNINGDAKTTITYAKQNEKFNSNFVKNKTLWAVGGWNSTQNFYYDMGLVLDERWEGFKTIATISVKEFDFTLVATLINKPYFEIPFSVRINDNAHLFLCTSANKPYNSDCYWIMLGSHENKKSGIRKCFDEKVNLNLKDYPSSQCAILVAERNGTLPFTITEWVHFILKKQNDTLSLIHDKEEILIYRDEYILSNVAESLYLYVSSREGVGFWKIHNYKFISTTKKELVQMGNSLASLQNKETVCVSMFIFMCKNCVLSLLLGETVYKNYTSENKSGWQHIRVNKKGNYSTTLRINTTSEEPDGFWAIDLVRECYAKDYRISIIEAKRNTTMRCQILGTSKFIEKSAKNTNDKDFLCETETEIGESCFNCANLTLKDKCFAKQVCEMSQFGNVNCYCASGYKGKNCKQPCESNFYGRNCVKPCGHCFNNARCDQITGHCEHCANNYNLPFCQDTLLPIAKEAPKIVAITPTAITIDTSNLKFMPSVNRPFKFTVQYKLQGAWEEYQKTYTFSEQNGNITISGLEKSRNYYIRYMLWTEEGKMTDQNVPVNYFMTTCDDIHQDDIEITTSNISATVSLKVTNDTCYIESYQYNIQNSERGVVPIKNHIIRVDGLNPYENYTFELYKGKVKIARKTFTTNEGVPESVKYLKQNKTTSTTIQLIWGEPKLNGILVHYVVTYKHLQYIACKNESLEVLHTETTKITNHLLSSLKPYSSYEITVFAENGENSGKPLSVIIYTLQKDRITEDEISQKEPEVHHKSPTVVEIQYKNIDCTKVQGPFFIKSSYRCVDKWCDKDFFEQAQFYIGISFTFTFNLLKPYSNYEIVNHVKRNDTFLQNVTLPTVSFRTLPSAPGVIQNLTIFSKNETSASLRWLAPNPPNGLLHQYQLKITPYFGKSFQRITTPKPCKLWPQFHCAAIKDLRPRTTHSIEVAGVNQNVSQTGKFVKARFYTKQEPSEPPQDVTVIWTDSNSLLLKWKHPDVTNGPIMAFRTKITCERSTVQYDNYQNISEFQLVYNKTIKNKDMRPHSGCEECTLAISAKNQNEGKPSIRKVNFPPKDPLYERKPMIESTANTTLRISLPSLKSSNNDSCLFIFMNTTNKSYEPRDCHTLIEDMNSFAVGNLVYAVASKHLQSLSHLIVGGTSLNDTSEIRNLNVTLLPETCYNISFLLVNVCNSKKNPLQSRNAYELTACTNDPKASVSDHDISASWYLLILLIVSAIIVGLLLVRYKYLKCSQSFSTFMINMRERHENPQNDLLPLNAMPRMERSQPTHKKRYSKCVKLMDFENYVKQAIETRDLEHQHQIIANLPPKSYDYGMQKANKSKNRYANLIAYDHSRVILDKIENDSFSDYINANYIKGYNSERAAYIATQGPKLNTLNDFWRMIWQEKVQHILMVANIYEGKKKKVEQYWPDINQKVTYGNITVECSATTSYPEYERRSFAIRKKDEKRNVQQLHFTSWPDHGVPMYSQSLVPFLKEMLTIPVGRSPPVVVHCSAGVGRTGTIILCDICLRMVATDNEIDVFNQLYRLRQQRANMVDNPEQYKLVHLVLLDMLFTPQAGISCDDKMEKAIQRFTQKSMLNAHMQYLEKTLWYDSAAKTLAREKSVLYQDYFPEKNRFPNIVPDELSIVHLASSNHSSSYINAVIVEGFRNLNKYIVTQQPLPNTMNDFWKMVDQMEISVIVSLNEINSNEKTSVQFWPEKNTPFIKASAHLSIIWLETIECETHDVYLLEVSTVEQETASKRKTYLVQMKNWSHKTLLPPNIISLLTVWQEMEVLSRGSQYTVVSCYDGATASGLLVALSFIIERMKLEQICDVCLAVRSIRQSRKHFVATEEQFKFLYDAALVYVKGFQTYSNFSQLK